MSKNNMCHTNNFLCDEDLVPVSHSFLPNHVKDYMQSLLSNRTTESLVIEHVKSLCNVNVTKNCLVSARKKIC